jgi:hypothetical protein
MGSVSPARRLNNTLLTLDEYLRVSIFEVEPLSRSLLVTGLTCRGIPFDSRALSCRMELSSSFNKKHNGFRESLAFALKIACLW